jgi:hypothetical protein
MFVGSAGSTENAIPVRKATEAGNDLVMMARRLDKRRVVRLFRQSGIEAHCRLLIGEALAMLERQINEAAPNRRDRTIVASGDGPSGGFQGRCVGGVSSGRMAEEIARQLVQQQDQSEAGLRRVPPGVGKTHLAVAIGRQAILTGYSVLFVPAPTLVAQLAKAHSEGKLEDRLLQFSKPKLLIVDELGYLSRTPPTCSSNWYPVDTRAAACWSPATVRSANGVRCLATRSWQPRSSTVCCTTATS